MKDPSARVAREAAKAIGKCSPTVNPNELWLLYTEVRRTNVRKIILRLLKDGNRWKTMPYLVMAATDQSAVITGEAIGALRQIRCDHNRKFFVNPNTEEALRINK